MFLPSVASLPCGVAVAAACASLLGLVIGSFSASSADDVGHLAAFTAHACCSFTHCRSRRFYCGEIMVMVSPLMKTVPSFRLTSPSTRSSALSSTTLMWMSNALRVPRYWRPFLSSTSTLLFLALLSASSGRAGSMIEITFLV